MFLKNIYVLLKELHIKVIGLIYFRNEIRRGTYLKDSRIEKLNPLPTEASILNSSISELLFCYNSEHSGIY